MYRVIARPPPFMGDKLCNVLVRLDSIMFNNIVYTFAKCVPTRHLSDSSVIRATSKWCGQRFESASGN